MALIERLKTQPDARVLEIGTGSGRNTAALEAAGLNVCAIPDERVHGFSIQGAYDAALSTHGLLHGTLCEIALLVDAIGDALRRGAPLFATFGSTHDARYGKGTQIDARTFSPQDGDEAGVAHAYFDAPSLRAVLAPRFTIETMEERSVDDVVGSWAHAHQLRGAVHWVLRATKRQ